MVNTQSSYAFWEMLNPTTLQGTKSNGVSHSTCLCMIIRVNEFAFAFDFAVDFLFKCMIWCKVQKKQQEKTPNQVPSTSKRKIYYSKDERQNKRE